MLPVLHGSKASDDVVRQRVYEIGTLVEFSEKNRIHAGKITDIEHKSNGGARYHIEDNGGRKFSIADKAVTYAMEIAPNDQKRVNELFDEFTSAMDESVTQLRKDLDISSELLEMAWEETLEGDESHELTPKSLIALVHSHAASSIDTYKAWKLLRTDMAHVLFKEIKDHGRVVSFKAKAESAVEAAKQTFCTNPDNAEDDFCWV